MPEVLAELLLPTLLLLDMQHLLRAMYVCYFVIVCPSLFSVLAFYLSLVAKLQS